MRAGRFEAHLFHADFQFGRRIVLDGTYSVEVKQSDIANATNVSSNKYSSTLVDVCQTLTSESFIN